jgi:glyoxylase-like metal-dependent hydrolase (beta-lactamase superfamily II)
VLFRQLFEPLSCTSTDLLGCAATGQAVLIDPVAHCVERDLGELERLRLRLAFTLDTHVHADHITGARLLRERVGSRIAAPAIDRLPCTDLGVEDGVPLTLGSLEIRPLHTPGHDYQGRRVSSIGQEKARNPRLGQGRTQVEFETITAALKRP